MNGETRAAIKRLLGRVGFEHGRWTGSHASDQTVVARKFDPVNLVIFSSREDVSTIAGTISSAVQSIPNGSIVDVLVNGNKQLAQQIDTWALQNIKSVDQLNIFYIPLPDKGNAWNQHIHTIWRESMNMNSIYIDGYVRVSRAAISALASTLECNVNALGTSGVPTVGASAKLLSRRMQREGGFHGNLCAIRTEALRQMRNRGVRIPLGMYRVDSLVGAFLSFNLDNINHAWDPHKCVPLTVAASWECEEKKWYRWKDVAAWMKRRNRQAQGDFENSAVKYHLTRLKCSFEELPSDVRSLVDAWMNACPEDVSRLRHSSVRHKKAMENIVDYVSPDSNACGAVLINSLTRPLA